MQVDQVRATALSGLAPFQVRGDALEWFVRHGCIRRSITRPESFGILVPCQIWCGYWRIGQHFLWGEYPGRIFGLVCSTHCQALWAYQYNGLYTRSIEHIT